MISVAILREREHIVIRAVLEQLLRLADGEAEPRGINQLFVFRLVVAVLVRAVARRIGHDVAVVRAARDQHAHVLLAAELRRFVRRLLRLPERVILRQRQHGERLHRPVRRTGRVVALGHEQVRIVIADGQHAVAREDGLAEPLAHVAQQQVLHHAVGHALALRLRQRLCRVERALREAVGEAAAVRQRLAGGIEPAGEVRRDELAALHILRAALRIARTHDLRVHQAVVVERPQGVILALVEVVKVPAVALVVLLDHGEVLVHARLVVRQATDHEAHVHQHAEERPVVLGHVVTVDLVKPGVQISLRLLRQREEELLRRQGHAHAEDRHLHQPLVIVLHLAPVLGMLRIDAVDDALLPDRPDRLHALAVSREHRHNRPQWAGKRLHLRDVRRIDRAGVAQVQPRLALAQQRDERLNQLDRRALHIRARAQGIVLHTVAHDISSS